MLDCLMTAEDRELRKEARAFVRDDLDKALLRDMDADKVRYPRVFLEKAAARGLLGLRFPQKYGGRGLPWASEIVALEEVGVLGTSLGCLYSLVSIVGEAINKFGSDYLKEKYLKPTIAGRLTAAEALTEPRGGSDFFGTTTIARREGDHYILNGQKRFVVGAEGADYFMVYARTREDGPPHESISTFIVDRGPGVEVKYVYGLMGTRGGGTGRLIFTDCTVPAENLLGVENQGGLIFYQMMIPERMTSAAGAVGGKALGAGGEPVAAVIDGERLAARWSGGLLELPVCHVGGDGGRSHDRRQRAGGKARVDVPQDRARAVGDGQPPHLQGGCASPAGRRPSVAVAHRSPLAIVSMLACTIPT